MRKGKGQAKKSIQSESNLRNEFEEIEKQLSDTNYSDEPYFPRAFENLATCLSIQLTDLRSGIVKQASHLITDAAELLGEEICGFGEKILSGGKLLKQINNGNKIVSELAHQCVLSILSNSVISKSIPKIIGEASSKNANVRARVAQYTSIMLDTFPDDVIEKNIPAFRKTIKKMLGDANPKARGFSRTCLDIVTERFPNEGRKIFDGLDASIKKQLSLSEPSTASGFNKKTITPKKRAKVVKEKSEDEEDFSDDPSEDEPEERSEERGSQRSSKVGSIRGVKQKSRPASKMSSGKRTNSRNRTMKLKEKKEAKPRLNATAKAKVNSRGKGRSSKNVIGSAKDKSKGKSFKRRKGPNKNYYEDAKLEELKDLLHEIDDENWAVRANNFSDISELLLEIEDDASVQIPESFKKSLFKKIIAKFDDIHIKVQHASLKSLNTNFDMFRGLITQKSSAILKKIIQSLSETKQNFRKLGGELLGKFTKEYTEREVLDLIIKIIHSFPNVKAQLKALELMEQIIGVIQPDDYTGSIVKSMINKVVFIFKDKMRDKDFTKTIFSILAKSFEKNNQQSNEYFCLLSPSLQNKVVEFAEKNDPDFLMVFEAGYEKISNEESFSEEGALAGEENNGGEIYEQEEEFYEEPKPKRASKGRGYEEYQEDRFEEETYAEEKRSNKREKVRGYYVNSSVRGEEQTEEALQEYMDEKENVKRPKRRGKSKCEEKSTKSVKTHKENRVPSKKTRKIDLNVDLIDPEDVTNIAKTLELLTKKLNQLKSNQKMMELKNLLIMAYPFMIKILSYEIEEVHSYCFDLIQSTYNFYDTCNDAFTLVLEKLLELFETNYSDLDLLHEVADLIILFPFRNELMKQMLEKLEGSRSPSLQLFLKLTVSLLSAANNNEIDLEDFKKGFMPVLARLVFYLTKHINNPNPEVRKGVVFILVELHFFLEEDNFMEIMTNFNNSQQKLVSIYIQKKLKKYSN